MVQNRRSPEMRTPFFGTIVASLVTALINPGNLASNQVPAGLIYSPPAPAGKVVLPLQQHGQRDDCTRLVQPLGQYVHRHTGASHLFGEHRFKQFFNMPLGLCCAGAAALWTGIIPRCRVTAGGAEGELHFEYLFQFDCGQ
jgi:hypothetical protein